MDDARRSAIVRLLETRDAYLPVRATAPFSSAGFVHRTLARESCSDCLANGKAMAGCETCSGRGYVEVRRGRDPYDSGQSLGVFNESSRKHEAAKERDKAIERLAEQLAPARKSDADITAELRPEGWEIARSKAWAEFDYALLDAAMEELRRCWEHAYHAIMAVHVYRWRAAGEVEEIVIGRGLEFLSACLPAELRSPRALVLAEVLPPRDSEIRRLIRDGAAAQWVARRFGLSVSQVYRVAAGKRESA